MHLLAKPRRRNAGKLSEPAIDADISDADLEKFDVPFRGRKLGAAALEQAETAPLTPRCASGTSLRSQTERNYSLAAPSPTPSPEGDENPPYAARRAQRS